MSIPVALNLRGRHVYIIGGGSVALRKAKQFLKEEAMVTVIASVVDEQLMKQQAIEIIQTSFSWDLVEEDCFYLYAATDDQVLNIQLQQAAKKRSILFGCSMYMENCDIYSMFSSNTEELQLALSTKGMCAGAARSLYEHYLAPKVPLMNDRISQLRILRESLLTQGVASFTIKEVLKELAQLDVSYSKQILLCLQTKRVLLLSYHGIANVKQEATTLAQMQQLVETKFPNYTCMSVFTSSKILAKAKRKGYDLASISSMINVLEALHISYWVQPMMLQRGDIYEELQSICKKELIGLPLWNTKEEFFHTYLILKTKYDSTLLGLYHPNHTFFEEAIKKDLFLPFDRVDLDHIIQEQIMVIPMVLLYGYHAKKDIEQTWMPALWKQGIHATLINTGLLSNQEIQRQFLERIKSFIQQTS